MTGKFVQKTKHNGMLIREVRVVKIYQRQLYLAIPSSKIYFIIDLNYVSGVTFQFLLHQ